MGSQDHQIGPRDADPLVSCTSYHATSPQRLSPIQVTRTRKHHFQVDHLPLSVMASTALGPVKVGTAQLHSPGVLKLIQKENFHQATRLHGHHRILPLSLWLSSVAQLSVENLQMNNSMNERMTHE